MPKQEAAPNCLISKNMTYPEADIVPYFASPVFHARQVLVFAPHPDDEVFGCGGALALHAKEGHAVHVILLTAGDSKPGVGADADYAGTRLLESAQAARALGLQAPECWQLPDRGLAYGEALVNRMKDAILALDADVIYAPSLWEAHPDHRAAAMSVVEAVRRLGGNRTLLLYEVSSPLRPQRLVDITSAWHQKAAAMGCFASQNTRLDYPEFIGALNRYRALTLPKESNRAEAFEVYQAQALNVPSSMPFATERDRLLSRGVAATPADVPLVSVIVRSMGRATLQAALASLQMQTYGHIELIVVDAAGNGLPMLDLKPYGFPTRLVSSGQALGRSAAANSGLDAAVGEHCIFLDDDDWFYPDHLAKLVMCALQHPTVRAVHTEAVCVDARGHRTAQLFDFPYAPNELKYGNFLPIHTVLFQRKLVELGCRFDQAFDLYEDWDFWLQVETHTAMAFVPGVSAAYRVDVASGAGVQTDPLQSRQATANVYFKWGVVRSEATFQDLVGRSVARRQLLGQLALANKTVADRDAEVQRLAQLASAQAEEAASSQRAAADARMDAHQLRAAHDMACRDRDAAHGASELAQSLGAIARNEAQLAAIQIGLARQEAEQARGAIAPALAQADDLRGQVLASEQRFADTLQAYEDQRDLTRVAHQEVLSAHAAVQQSRQSAELAEAGAAHARRAEREARALAEAAEGRATQLTVDLDQFRARHGEVQRELEGLQADRAAKLARIAAIEASSSWRVTKPLRWVGSVVRKASTAGAVLAVARQRMGLIPAARRALAVYRREGATGLRLRMSRLLHRANGADTAMASLQSTMSEVGSYGDWVGRYDSFDIGQMNALGAVLAALPSQPLISIVMPTYNPAAEVLTSAIESVKAQIYSNWELCVCDDASTQPHVRRILDQFARSDPRIKVSFQKKNGHISRASNEAIQMARGDFVAFLDHDDALAPHALLRVAEAIARRPDARVFYSDEDKIDAQGHRFDPYFKPDFNLGLLRSHNYMCHFAVYEAKLLKELKGLRVGFEGAQDYDLALRAIDAVPALSVVHLPHVLYHWRTAVGSTAAGHGEKSYAFSAGQRALAEHLTRRKLHARVEEAPEASGMYRMRWITTKDAPLVSIVIPTRNGEPILRQCLDSLRATSYPNFEVIVVDNGSDDAEALALLAQRVKEGQIRVLRDDCAFNFSALNNRAVQSAAGEFVLLLNNDIEVINADRLDDMVGAALEPGVGCVGARLWYPDGRLQHAGVILVCGVAGHAHKYLPRGRHGYMGRAVLAQDMIGVTAACLLVRRSIYLEVGGLDETLAIAFNDVDFCLRVHSAGYRNHWTPNAELIHHESVTRGFEDTPEKQIRFKGEIDKMQARWPELLAYDPCYSPNLTNTSEDMSFAWPPRRDLP